MELAFRMRQTPDVQSINAGISGLEMFYCSFDKRSVRNIQVILFHVDHSLFVCKSKHIYQQMLILVTKINRS